jgi:diguanylate cyclase (GGDEF)-like protein/PAS domain S-box-containing protein
MIRILVVEADIPFFTQFQELLAEEGSKTYEVVHAVSLKQGLAHLTMGKFDLALVDLYLPDSQGLLTYTQFAGAVPGLAVIVLGNIEDKTLLTKAVRKGAQSYLVKESLNAERLLQTLQHTLEQFKNRQALQDIGKQNRQLLAHIPLPVVALDRELVIQYCNEAYARFVEKPLKELTGKKIHELFPRFTITRSYHAYRKCLETGQVQEVTGRFGNEYYHVRVFPTQSGLLEIGQNITRDKQLKAALRQSEERYHSIFDGARDAILVETPDGRILDVNSSACELFGYNRKEFLNLRVTDIAAPETIIGLATDLGELEKNLPRTPVEAINIRADGERFPVEISARLQTMNDETVVIVVVREIGERKRTEQLVQRRDAILEAINLEAGIFLKALSWEEHIGEVLEKLGQTAGVSRVYIFQNQANPDGEMYTRQIYEWVAPGITPQIDKPMLNIPLGAEESTHIKNILSQGQVLNARVRDLNEVERSVMMAQDILSLLMVPVFVDESWWGFIGFDDCLYEREWSIGEIDAVRIAADILGAAIQRKKSMDELHYHASLEMLITAITTRFISVPSEAVESEINHSLQALGEFIGADRAHLYLLSDDRSRMKKGYEWYSAGSSAGLDHLEGLPVKTFIWFFNILRRFDFINVGRVEDLPMEASAEKEHWLAESVHSTLAFPLVLNNALIGFWGFNAEHSEKSWTEADVNLLKLVGDVLGAALAKKWAEEALRASEAQYRLLAEGISDIVMLHDLEGRLVYISPSVQKVLGWAETEAARSFMQENIHPDDRDMLLRLFENQLKKGQDVNLQWRFRHKAGQFVWMDTHVHVILENDRPYRWLSSSRDISARKLAEEELQKANEKLTHTVAELQKRNREATLLSEMSDMLQSCLKPDEIYEVVAQYNTTLFADCSGALYILNSSQGFVEAVTSWGDYPPQELVFETDACWALRRGRTHIYQAGSSDLACKHIDKQSETYVCIPMSAQGEAIGMLHLTGGSIYIHERFEQLAVMVAERVALALTNLKLRLTLHMQSIRDPLTSLFNRRFMDESLEREVHRASRNHQPISIIMMDIDHFKAFNDAYGHEVGDALLQVIGSYLTGNTRGGDLACRFGGEEFLLILPEATLENTIRRAEEFRKGIKGLMVQQKDRLLGGITISIGIAGYPEHGQTVEALLRAVDVALYRAKEAGRDCVVVAQSA